MTLSTNEALPTAQTSSAALPQPPLSQPVGGLATCDHELPFQWKIVPGPVKIPPPTAQTSLGLLPHTALSSGPFKKFGVHVLPSQCATSANPKRNEPTTQRSVGLAPHNPFRRTVPPASMDDHRPPSRWRMKPDAPVSPTAQTSSELKPQIAWRSA